MTGESPLPCTAKKVHADGGHCAQVSRTSDIVFALAPTSDARRDFLLQVKIQRATNDVYAAVIDSKVVVKVQLTRPPRYL